MEVFITCSQLKLEEQAYPGAISVDVITLLMQLTHTDANSVP